MIFRRKSVPELPRDARARLGAVVSQHLGEADPELVRIVTSIAGLLACVAYEDRVFTEEEQRQVRGELGRIQSLLPAGVEAVLAVLRDHIAELASGGDHGYTRELRDLASRELRLEVLEVLVDLAAIDGVLTISETNFLRRLALGLGLTQAEYDAQQARHRDKLAVLKEPIPGGSGPGRT